MLFQLAAFGGPIILTVYGLPLEDRQAGNLPGYRWLSTGHSNSLVPVFARGAGVAKLVAAADLEDPFRGPYLDQTEIFAAVAAALTGG